MDNKILRQIKVPYNLYKAIKCYVVQHDTTMTKFYYDMLEWYFEQKPAECYASYKKGYGISIPIESKHLEKVKFLAETDNVSDARVIYTALMLYTRNKNIIY